MNEADLNDIIKRADQMLVYGNATHVPELAGMVLKLAQAMKTTLTRLDDLEPLQTGERVSAFK